MEYDQKGIAWGLTDMFEELLSQVNAPASNGRIIQVEELEKIPQEAEAISLDSGAHPSRHDLHTDNLVVISTLRQRLREELEKKGVSLDDRSDLCAALGEALTNVAKHAYAPDKVTKPAELELYILRHRNCFEVILQVRDFGKGIDSPERFEPGNSEFSHIPLDEIGSSLGKGFTLIAAFVDRLIVWTKANEGTVLRMLKEIRT